tara:strand:- start:279 stop:458 length:180 start_codon:yes stop_codon:yes gene_type:complete
MNIKQAIKYLENVRFEKSWLLNDLQSAYAKAKNMEFENDNLRMIWMAEYVYDIENSTAR